MRIRQFSLLAMSLFLGVSGSTDLRANGNCGCNPCVSCIDACDCLDCRETLTGDWCGIRSVLGENGIAVNVGATQYYQGVAAGGREQDFEYGAKLDYRLDVDGGKAGLWQGVFINMHAETNLGQSINGYDGLLLPANLHMAFPEGNRHVTSITGLKVTQALSESFALFAGKINTLDEYPLKYHGGTGMGGFMNSSLLFNPIAARTIVYSAAGAGFAVLNEGKPVFAFSVFDPEERATKGMDDLFARGVVLVPDLTLRVAPGGLPGIYNFGGTYSTADYRSIDPSAYLEALPILPGNAPRETESWSIYSNFYQALWVDHCDPTRSWGVFGQFGVSDGNPNPVRFVANGGIGGHSFLPGRSLDTFGVGYYYVGLSDEFKALTAPLIPQQDERGVELFYNYSISPWCRVTADLQIGIPSTTAIDTAILPGMRMETVF